MFNVQPATGKTLENVEIVQTWFIVSYLNRYPQIGSLFYWKLSKKASISYLIINGEKKMK